jgi:DNA modification methylase
MEETKFIDKIFCCDVLEGLKTLPDNSVDCCVTSPPYYALRDYGCDGQIGLEDTPERYVDRLTEVFTEVYRVLKSEGTLWLNIGDSYWGGGDGEMLRSTNIPPTYRKARKGLIAETLCLPARGNRASTSRKTLSAYRGCSLSH